MAVKQTGNRSEGEPKMCLRIDARLPREIVMISLGATIVDDASSKVVQSCEKRQPANKARVLMGKALPASSSQSNSYGNFGCWIQLNLRGLRVSCGGLCITHPLAGSFSLWIIGSYRSGPRPLQCASQVCSRCRSTHPAIWHEPTDPR